MQHETFMVLFFVLHIVVPVVLALIGYGWLRYKWHRERQAEQQHSQPVQPSDESYSSPPSPDLPPRKV
jgi:hypothetical protein